MLEIGLIASLFFILIAVIASYLLKYALIRNDAADSSVENTRYVATGIPHTRPISSVKVMLIIPGMAPAGLSVTGKLYLLLVRASLFLALLAVFAGIALEASAYA